MFSDVPQAKQAKLSNIGQIQITFFHFLMRDASSKKDCLSVCVSVRLSVCPYVTLPLQTCKIQTNLREKVHIVSA